MKKSLILTIALTLTSETSGDIKEDWFKALKDNRPS